MSLVTSPELFSEMKRQEAGSEDREPVEGGEVEMEMTRERKRNRMVARKEYKVQKRLLFSYNDKYLSTFSSGEK
jgi:hypothetical protein